MYLCVTYAVEIKKKKAWKNTYINSLGKKQLAGGGKVGRGGRAVEGAGIISHVLLLEVYIV